jgi:chemotaxis signal transduction protein
VRHGPRSHRLDVRAAEMRAEFDASFAAVPMPRRADPHSVLSLRVDDEPCLVRLADVARVIARPALTAVPTPTPALLGLTFSQGDVIAVYDLGRLLGRSPLPPRWLVVAAADPSIGLAFARFDGHRRITGEEPGSVLLDMTSLIGSVRAFTTLNTTRETER